MTIRTTLVFIISPIEVLLAKSIEDRVYSWQYRYVEDEVKEDYLKAHPEFKEHQLYVDFKEIEVGESYEYQITDYREYKEYLERIGSSEIEWLDDSIFNLEMDKQNIAKESSLFCRYFGDADTRRSVGSHINEDSECSQYVRWLEKIAIEYRDACLEHLEALKYLLDKHPDHIADVSKMIYSWSEYNARIERLGNSQIGGGE